MRTLTRSIAIVSALLATFFAVGGTAAAQDEVVYLTKFLAPAEDAADWGFPKGETEVTEDGYDAAFTDGALTLTLDGAANAWLWPDGLDIPANQAVEAQVAASTGDESALFGVACRADLPSTGYAFLIGTDGYYTIGRYSGGKAKAIVNANGSKRTDAVDPTGTNLIRGECVGKKQVTLTLTVNGEEVASFVDKKPPKKVGSNATVVTEVAKGGTTTTEFSAFAVHGV